MRINQVCDTRLGAEDAMSFSCVSLFLDSSARRLSRRVLFPCFSGCGGRVIVVSAVFIIVLTAGRHQRFSLPTLVQAAMLTAASHVLLILVSRSTIRCVR